MTLHKICLPVLTILLLHLNFSIQVSSVCLSAHQEINIKASRNAFTKKHSRHIRDKSVDNKHRHKLFPTLMRKCSASALQETTHGYLHANSYGQSNQSQSPVIQAKEDALEKLNTFIHTFSDVNVIPKINSAKLGRRFDEAATKVMARFDENLKELFHSENEKEYIHQFIVLENEINKMRAELAEDISQAFLKIYLKHLKHLHDKYTNEFSVFMDTEIQNSGDSNLNSSEKVAIILKQFRESSAQASYVGGDTSTWHMFAQEMSNILSLNLQESARNMKNKIKFMLKSGKNERRLQDQVRMLQQHIQSLQQNKQLQIPLTAAVAFKPPNTNINLSGVFSEGKLSLQMAAVADESAPLLGPNGFVHGVPPGNMGVSFNLNM